ncbi:hypothetical protein INR49_013189, partial [Caranx melampygus]
GCGQSLLSTVQLLLHQLDPAVQGCHFALGLQQHRDRERSTQRGQRSEPVTDFRVKFITILDRDAQQLGNTRSQQLILQLRDRHKHKESERTAKQNTSMLCEYSACSALSMAFSLSNFSICIFFLMASM